MSDIRTTAPTHPSDHRLSPALPRDLRWLRGCGIAEGISTLALFGVAMPLKYAAGMPQAVTLVGSIHGGLFMLYAAVILLTMVRHHWPWRRGAALAVAAIVPGGPFVLDRKIPHWFAADAEQKRGPRSAPHGSMPRPVRPAPDPASERTADR